MRTIALLPALAALLAAGCGDPNGGVIKPSASSKNPMPQTAKGGNPVTPASP